MKLTGIKVIDLSLFLPGPHMSMMMADHGAQVIKIEPPTLEPTRNIGLEKNGHTVWFRNTHRGKKSICLDLKKAAAKEVLLTLCEDADVFIESFRPGTAKRLGIDYESVKKRSHNIVYCSISAYGQSGSKHLNPAHDLSIQADSGTISINEGFDQQPCSPGMPVADMAGSLMALSGILMALLRRQQTGQGDYLDISMQDSLIAWLPNALGPVFAEQRAPIVKEERSWGGSAMYQIYRTNDNQYLSLGGGETKFAINLLTALNREDLIPYSLKIPGPGQNPIKEFFRTIFATKTLKEWKVFLNGIDICWSPVRDLHEAIHETHLKERDMLLVDDDGNEHLGAPMKFLQEPATPNFKLAEPGEDNRSILLAAGYDEKDINEMIQQGVLLQASS